MSLAIALLERCVEFASYFGKMRRDKVYAFGVICIFGWMVVTYILFSHEPPIFESKFTRSHRNKIDHEAFYKLRNNIDRFSVRLKQQMRESDQLLVDLKDIVDRQKSEEQNRQRSQEQKLEVKTEFVTKDPPKPENVVIPILMFACNRVSVTKAIDPLLKYRGDDPARKAKFPIIVSQVSYKPLFIVPIIKKWGLS